MNKSFSDIKRSYDVDTIFLKVPHMTIRSNIYLMKNKYSIILIDTGVNIQENITELSKYISSKKINNIYILLTHEHTDHMGLAHFFQKYYRSVIFVHKKARNWALNFDEEWNARNARVIELLSQSNFPELYINIFCRFNKNKIYAKSFVPDKYVNHNDILDIEGRKFKVVYTPGHSIGSVCYYDYNNKLLFSGDHIVGGYNMLPTIEYNCMSSKRYASIYNSFQSFEKLDAFGNDMLALPGHGNIITDIKKYKNEYLAYIQLYKYKILNVFILLGKLTPFDLYIYLYKQNTRISAAHFFGRLQLMYCILDYMETESLIIKMKEQGKIKYILNKGMYKHEPI